MTATVAEEKFLLSIADRNKPYHLDCNKLRRTMIQLEDYLELKSSSFILMVVKGKENRL